jgi:N-methylhydantoinase A
MRIGVDIGGTFTDFVFFDEPTGEVRLEKTLTTPGDLWAAIDKGLSRGGIDLASVSLFVHGTTVGLNTLLEKKGPATGLITTRGFRDVYEIGRHNRVEMYDLFYRKPEPLIPREARLEVSERMDARGGVLVPLDEREVRDCARHFRDAGTSSIAVCLLHAYANPAHEARVGAILAEELPDAFVSLSHQIAREWREYERTSTTAINAYILPVVGRYLSRIEKELDRRGCKGRFYINKSSGGIMPLEAARVMPVHTIMSGPSGGAVSAAHAGRAAGFDNVIAFDMGGTSTDVSVTHEGRTQVTTDARIEGHPILVPMINVHSIGAGGGSIAWLNTSGALNVGPQSAGAEPGPVCYRRGGSEPAVTDANLVLGRLDPAFRLGGEIELDPRAAREAIQAKIARPLGLTMEQAAAGIIAVVNTRMAYAVRAITVQKGLDPRDFVLLAFGGAGPMHACELAREIGIPRVIVPTTPGNFSALGMLLSDIRYDFVRTRLSQWEAVRPSDLEAVFTDLWREAELAVKAEEGMGGELAALRSVGLRYAGQEYTVEVPVPDGPVDAAVQAGLRRSFDALHERTYGHASESEPAEMINARLTVHRRMPKVVPAPLAAGGAAPSRSAVGGRLSTLFEPERGWVECTVYVRDRLLAGNLFDGPALVQEQGATTIVPPGFRCTVDPAGNLLIAERNPR